ncbi:hypothetical protein F4824DRAFT_310668 [Ustulina deusta]|nr:hypothetical protein F4824DRAFT_310668 [Ustulina deusta]
MLLKTPSSPCLLITWKDVSSNNTWHLCCKCSLQISSGISHRLFSRSMMLTARRLKHLALFQVHHELLNTRVSLWLLSKQLQFNRPTPKSSPYYFSYMAGVLRNYRLIDRHKLWGGRLMLGMKLSMGGFSTQAYLMRSGHAANSTINYTWSNNRIVDQGHGYFFWPSAPSLIPDVYQVDSQREFNGIGQRVSPVVLNASRNKIAPVLYCRSDPPRRFSRRQI